IGNFQPAIISGQVFDDVSKNAIKDPGDPGLAGWTVFIDKNNNGIKDAGELFTTTDASGNYSLSVPPGTYIVRELVAPGWLRTTTTPASIVFTTGSLTTTVVTFGNFQLDVICGQLFNDANSSAAKDAGETGLQGWTVFLDKNNNGIKDAGELFTTT